jgi:ribosome modulation factor
MSNKQNPYPPEDEIRHQSWAHGYNSKSKDECPYEKGTLEADDALPAWNAGFKAGQRDKGRTATPEAQKSTPNRETEQKVVSSSIESADDETLMNELRRRKSKEYKELLEMRAEIDKQLERLRFLFDD